MAGSLSSPLAPSPFTSTFTCSFSGPVQNTTQGCPYHALIITLNAPPSLPLFSGWEQWFAFLVSTLCSCGPTSHVTAKVFNSGQVICSFVRELHCTGSQGTHVIHGSHLPDPNAYLLSALAFCSTQFIISSLKASAVAFA